MYIPAQFANNDTDDALRLMQQYPFALLITTLDGEFEGTHIPTLTTKSADELTIQFHLARANPSVSALAEQRKSLLIFNGPNAYVSPDWYGEHKPNMVPTWNYAVVHARGVAQVVDDDALVVMLQGLSAQGEQRLQPKRPWTTDKMDDRAFTAMRNAIVGYEFRVCEIQTKFKMSQNRDLQQRKGVRTALQDLAQNEHMAQTVSRLIPE